MDEDITREILLLYELSLSIGQTLDPRKTGRDFLRVLMSRRDLNGAAIWWPGGASQNAPGRELSLLEGIPRKQFDSARIPALHPLWKLPRTGQPVILAPENPQFQFLAGNGTRACALIPLGNQGVLQMNSSSSASFTPRILKQMRTVLMKLTVAIQGGMAHQQLTESEAELRKSEQKLLTILDNVDACIYVKDPEGKYLFANKAVRDLWHSNMEDVVGFGDEKFFDLTTAANIRINDRQVLDDGDTVRAEEVNTVPLTGKTVIYQSTKLPLRNDQGQIYALCGISTDVTVRRQAEIALAERELHLRTLIEAVPDNIQFKDGEGRWLVANSMCLRTMGLEGKDWRGLTDAEIGDRYPSLKSALAACRISDDTARDTGSPYRSEEQIADRNGNMAFFDVFKVPLREGNQGRSSLVIVSRDITDRKRSEIQLRDREAQLRESQKMEALGTLAGGIAHDFNNILAAIMGHITLAREDIGAGHPAMESLDQVAKASRRAADLVQQILAFSRRKSLERKPVNLARVVSEAATLLKASVPSSINLVVNCESNTPLVLADETQIKQMLINLCSNAMHAIDGCPRPGLIRISLEDYRTEQARNGLSAGRYARLSVKDNGAGMDEATLARIFEPFFTTKPVGKGTGLGLAVVHSMVQANDGVIEVNSAPGEGSCFTLHFPATEDIQPDNGNATHDFLRVHGRGVRVLYIDDEEIILQMTKRLLDRRGFSVTPFVNPEKAIAALQANASICDVVVTDYNMPVMSGLAVLRAIRIIRPELPVFLASGFITEDLSQQAVAAGVTHIIRKPFTADELCQALARFAIRHEDLPNGRPKQAN